MLQFHVAYIIHNLVSDKVKQCKNFLTGMCMLLAKLDQARLFPSQLKIRNAYRIEFDSLMDSLV